MTSDVQFCFTHGPAMLHTTPCTERIYKPRERLEVHLTPLWVLSRSRISELEEESSRKAAMLSSLAPAGTALSLGAVTFCQSLFLAKALSLQNPSDWEGVVHSHSVHQHVSKCTPRPPAPQSPKDGESATELAVLTISPGRSLRTKC